MKRRVVTRGEEFLRMGQRTQWSCRTVEGAALPTALVGDHGYTRIIEFEIGRDLK